MRLVFATISFILANAVYAFSQVPVDDPFPDFGRNRDRSEETRMIREMLSKQESAREKKKFAELQQRGEQALIIAKEINESFAKNKTLTASDRKKLDELEKLIKKLQDNLGPILIIQISHQTQKALMMQLRNYLRMSVS